MATRYTRGLIDGNIIVPDHPWHFPVPVNRQCFIDLQILASLNTSSAKNALLLPGIGNHRLAPASASSRDGSRQGSVVNSDRPNSFEAVGTVRMEAFVDPNVRDGVLYVPAPPPVIGAPRRPRRGSNLSQSTVDKRRAGYVFDEDGMDPFKGF